MSAAKRIFQLLTEIAKIEGKAISSEDAKNKGLLYYYAMDNNTIYGGYRIVNVKLGSGAQFGTFGESDTVGRRKPKEMITFLEGILYGLTVKK